MPRLARLGDTASGTCGRHSNTRNWTGVIDTVTDTAFTIGGTPAAGVGDSGSTDCGHRFVIVQGSPLLTHASGKVYSREGDAVEIIGGSGVGTITSGSDICNSS